MIVKSSNYELLSRFFIFDKLFRFYRLKTKTVLRQIRVNIEKETIILKKSNKSIKIPLHCICVINN